MIFNPALVAVMSESTIILGGTFLSLIYTRSNSPTLTPEKMAVIHKLTGTKYRKIKKAMRTITKMIKIDNGSMLRFNGLRVDNRFENGHFQPN